jgi:hypothetical protein
MSVIPQPSDPIPAPEPKPPRPLPPEPVPEPPPTNPIPPPNRPSLAVVRDDVSAASLAQQRVAKSTVQPPLAGGIIAMAID